KKQGGFGKSRPPAPQLIMPDEIRNSKSIEARGIELKLLRQYPEEVKAYISSTIGIKFEDSKGNQKPFKKGL
ncbi:MAG: hypothetical protein N3G22_05150, partial [Candidatus Micrarchaeota archaeon]|nr:hypothetical protein [Candidatus Micrarchaeota archaeon]